MIYYTITCTDELNNINLMITRK